MRDSLLKSDNLMKTPKQRNKKRRSQNTGMNGIIGAGLILLGISLFLIWPHNNDASASSPSASSSVVPMAVNFRAPELSLTTISGETQSLGDFHGKVVLVNNWATWCPPCKAEMPTLEKYYENHTNEGFTIIAIEAGEPSAQVAEFAKSYGLKFNVWVDQQNAALKAFGNGNLPNSYVIDRTGNVRYAWTGEISMEMLEKYVTPVINEN